MDAFLADEARARAVCEGPGSVALLSLALLAGATFACAGDTAYPGRNGSILVMRDVGPGGGSGSHIFLVQPDVSGLRDVAPPGFWDIPFAAWSPDGRWIAFDAFKEPNGPDPDLDSDIYVMNADGSGVRELTRTDIGEREPTWSPDGRWLAFTSAHGGLSRCSGCARTGPGAADCPIRQSAATPPGGRRAAG